MRILVLGSAAGGGFPQWNCRCGSCLRARAGDPAAAPRTQSSLAVTADERHWFLLNASPDLRQQIEANPPLHPATGTRHSPVAGVVLTNADVDHVAGLLSLRESQPLALYADARVLSTLRENNIFNILNADLVGRRALPQGEPVELCTRDGRACGLAVEAFAVPGKVALYKEDPAAGPDLGSRPGDTIGLAVTATASGARFFYVPGCAALPQALAARLADAPLVFFDSTLWTDDEMIAAGTGAKTGRRMGHMSLSGPDGTLAAFAPLRVRRKVCIHINNTNPILLADSPERARLVEAGWEVGYDGMEIRL